MQNQSSLPDNNRLALRYVARSCRKAALSTNLDQAPYVSLVTVAFDHDLSPLLLLSELADHSRAIALDARCALLLDGTEGHPNPQTGPRVTVTGMARRDNDPRVKSRFLAHHPGAALYAEFADFSIWRIEPIRAHFVGGFGRAVWFDAPFGLDGAAVAALTENETGLMERLNGPDLAEMRQEVAHRAGGNTGDWRISGVDPDGVDLSDGEYFLRWSFPTPLVGHEAPQMAESRLFSVLKK